MKKLRSVIKVEPLSVIVRINLTSLIPPNELSSPYSLRCVCVLFLWIWFMRSFELFPPRMTAFNPSSRISFQTAGQVWRRFIARGENHATDVSMPLASCSRETAFLPWSGTGSGIAKDPSNAPGQELTVTTTNNQSHNHYPTTEQVHLSGWN